MPTFEITAPDGKVFEVTGPEGSTPEQALAQVQAQYKQKPQLPTGAETAMRFGRRFLQSGPLGLAAEGVGQAMENIDKAGEAAGGAVTDTLAKVAPPEVAAGVGTAVKMAPNVAGFVAGSNLGKPAMEMASRRVMQSALKPTSKAIANGKAAQAITTMLDEGVNATPGGAVKLRFQIGKLKEQLAKAIDDAPGAIVQKHHVYRELSKTLDDVTKQGNPDSSIEAVKKAWAQFQNHPLIQGDMRNVMTDTIPVRLADELKRGTQRAVKDSYGRLTTTPADDLAQKAIASGLRQGVEEAVPATAGINAKLSQYINALHQIEPKAAVQANKDLGGLVPLAHSPEAAMMMLADRNPWMKSLIARVLHEGRQTIPGTAGFVAAGSE